MPVIQFKPDFEQRVGLVDPLKADRAAGNWLKVDFDPPFASDKSVVVIPMTQTYKGPEIPGLRIRNVTRLSFEIWFDEANILKAGGAYASDGNHVDERVGWVAYGFRK